MIPRLVTRDQLIRLPKAATSLKRKAKANEAHMELDLGVEATGVPGEFSVYVRVCLELAESWSVGLLFKSDAGIETLLRLNGDHGEHGNPDGSKMPGGAHVHQPTTEEAQLTPGGRWQPRYAVAAPDVTSLPQGWARFKALVQLSSSPKLDAAVERVYQRSAQEALRLDLDEDE